MPQLRSRAILAHAIPPHWNLPPDPEFAGIYIGGCISGAGMSSYYAHAHCRRKGFEPFGWICIRDHGNVVDAAGMPSQTLLHEYAHILTDDDHTVRWAAVLRQLGGSVDPRYVGLPYVDQRPRTNGRRASARSILKDIAKIKVKG